jgi:RNA-directed DNA polymerase
MMNGHRESDSLIVSGKPSNKVRGNKRAAEGVERSRLAKGNSSKQNRGQTLSWITLPNELDRVRQAAQRNRGEQFTALWHHVYEVGRLRKAYFSLERRKAAGVDGQTWEEYGMKLGENLRGLSERLRRGAYRAKPVRRTYIPKRDGRKRPIGIPVLEDKVVQRSMVDVLNAIYEVDFKGFSYGFRPWRSPHNALDAVVEAIEGKKVNWVLDVDIRGFFDAIDHGWLVRFVEHRIKDRRVVRHIKKWLNAGILEDRQWRQLDEGTPQGGSASPLLANIYLHYVFDLWADSWRRRKARGDIIIVRYADDIILGFQYRHEAERFLKFNLELHSDKARLIEFGRFAVERRKERGEGKPGTFNFLGFTHICGSSRKGKFMVLRKTESARMRNKLQEIRETLRQRMHWSIPEVGQWLKTVLRGHYQYYGVPWNGRMLSRFRWIVMRLWCKTLRRRSQKRRITWKRMYKIAEQWLPNPFIYHPYPLERLYVTT